MCRSNFFEEMSRIVEFEVIQNVNICYRQNFGHLGTLLVYNTKDAH
jgi:hypothetical protein